MSNTLKISVEQGRMVTILNIIFSVVATTKFAEIYGWLRF